MDASATISVDPRRLTFARPPERDPRADDELNRVLLLGNRLETERLLRDIRVPAAQAYVRANGLDRVAFGASKPRIGIVATGKAYRDLRQAFDMIGIDEARARDIGLAIYKVAMPWPLVRDVPLAGKTAPIVDVVVTTSLPTFAPLLFLCVTLT